MLISARFVEMTESEGHTRKS